MWWITGALSRIAVADIEVFSKPDSSYDVVYGPVARSWWGLDRSSVYRDYDQISFHGAKGQGLLRDATLCMIEVIE